MMILGFLLGLILILIIVIRDKTFKTMGIICFIISLIIALIAFIDDYDQKRINENFKKSKSSIFVVVKNESSHKTSYFEINDKGDKRKLKKFKYNKNEILYPDYDCFDSYCEKNEITNAFMEDSCKVFDKNRNMIEYDNTIRNILIEISKSENTILYSRIILYEDKYYVLIAFNVNWWSPNVLYKYENGKLKHIYTFNGEEVISLKEIVKEN